MKPPTLPMARDVVMLALGAGGIAHELFLVAAPNPVRMAVSVVLLSGTAALNGWWLLQWLRSLPVPPASSPTAGPASSPPSPSSPPPS